MYPWVKRNTKSGGNMIAHLLFYFIATDEFNEFFYNEGWVIMRFMWHIIKFYNYFIMSLLNQKKFPNPRA